MGIYYDDNRKVFHLQSEKSSYIIEMIKGVIPAHVYCTKIGRERISTSVEFGGTLLF